jgi:2Fe-2S ferredoxin
MVKIVFRTHDGAVETTVDAQPGASLMTAATRARVDGIEAVCGGSMVCGTCQVYVDDQWLGNLPPQSEGEKEIIEFSVDPRPNSRLACQIVVGPQHEGMVVTTPVAYR